MDKKDVKVLFEPIYNEVLILHAKWKVFLELFSVSDERMSLLINVAPLFFGIIRNMIRDDAFMVISRLTDKPSTSGQENLSLDRVVLSFREIGESKIADELDSILNKINDAVKNIRWWRSKRLAHLDLKVASELIPDPTRRVIRGAIDESIDLIREFINKVANYFQIDEISFETIDVNDEVYKIVEMLST